MTLKVRCRLHLRYCERRTSTGEEGPSRPHRPMMFRRLPVRDRAQARRGSQLEVARLLSMQLTDTSKTDLEDVAAVNIEVAN